MEKQIIIPGEPMGKERPRTFMQHGMVLTYTPDKTRNYETLTRMIFKKKYGKELFPSREKPISVKITAIFQLPKKSKYEFPVKKPDADNIAKIVCDALKCVIAVLLGGLLFTLIAGDSSVSPQVINVGKYLAGIFCILGHSFPLYFHFKGGKGVVSAAALMLTEDWRVFLMILATFLILFLISKIISLGSIAGAVLYGPYTFIATFLFDRLVYGDNLPSIAYVVISTAAALIIGIFVTIKHKDNIGRLIRGEEKKIKAKK